MIHWNSGKVILADNSLKAAVRGKRIAMMVNGTAIHNDGRLLLDIICEEKWCDVAFFLGMEHGVRCNFFAGQKDQIKFDEKTGIPIISLYDYPGQRPPVEELKKVDAVVFCAQDAGVRHWTFTPWMLYLLDAAEVAGCEVIIVDRPNPIGGNAVEGNIVEEKYLDTLLSGFGYPRRHGMTVGELAIMYCEEKKLRIKPNVIRMDGWERWMFFLDTGLLWIPPTACIPTPESFLDFATTGLLQSSNLSVGDGTVVPFKFVGRPEFDSERLAQELNSRGLDDVFFAPKFFMATTRFERDRSFPCNGVLCTYKDKYNYRPVRAQLHIIDAIAKLYSDVVRFEHKPSWARKRMGTDDIYSRLESGSSVLDLIEKWDNDADNFKKRRADYLLYK